MENAACYAPQILVSTEDLPREQWLEYRRKGIGGSDAAAVLGISPFRTGRDLYYDKLNIVTADDAENWVQLEVGTLLEPLVAKIFAHKTGYKIYRRPFMFQHPLYPWMLADLDYMVELPDGTTAILEIKTTNYNAKDNWWYNGEEIVPIYYESQGRHYMAVMNIDRVYFCCLYGNSEDEAMIRRIDRDMAYEEELIALERDFWENHVLTKTPPPYVEADGDLILESLRRKLGPADKDAPPVLLGQTQFGQLSMLLSLQEQKKALSADVSKLDKDIKRLKGRAANHVNTMLTIALQKMIDRCECVLFLNTNQSILPYEKTLRDATESPWIYSEIVCTQLIRHKELKEYRKEIFHEDQRMLFEASGGFHPAYSVSLDHLMPLNMGDLMEWEQNYPKNTPKHHPLDYLYKQLAARN